MLLGSDLSLIYQEGINLRRGRQINLKSSYKLGGNIVLSIKHADKI